MSVPPYPCRMAVFSGLAVLDCVCLDSLVVRPPHLSHIQMGNSQFAIEKLVLIRVRLGIGLHVPLFIVCTTYKLSTCTISMSCSMYNTYMYNSTIYMLVELSSQSRTLSGVLAVHACAELWDTIDFQIMHLKWIFARLCLCLTVLLSHDMTLWLKHPAVLQSGGLVCGKQQLATRHGSSRRFQGNEHQCDDTSRCADPTC